MPLMINSPVQAMNTMRALRQTQGALSKTLRHISSGVRLDVAADDPGRLGSSTLAESQARGMRQSIRNLNDGLSLSQTLEGGLAQIDLALQRLRELSVQAANETYNATDRDALQAEVAQMIAQIDKVVEQTKFNGIGLMDGSARSLELFVDQPNGASETLGLDLVKIDTQEMSRRAHYVSERRGTYLGTLSTGDVKINGVSIRGTVESDDELSMSYKAGSAIAKAKAINAVSSITGVTARAAANVVTANRAVSGFELNTQNWFMVNGHKISGFDIKDFDADNRLLDSINAAVEETGVKAQLDAYGQLQLIAEDGRNIQIRYSNMLTMLSIGLADTSGDEVNLKGIVEQSTVMPPIDLFGSIQNVVALPANNYAGNMTIGGEFDPGRDFVDYVVQVIKGGPLGTAQFRIKSETGSELVPAEDFTFIEAPGAYPTSHTANMEYFQGPTGQVTNGATGAVIATGNYNEGPDRVYTLKVVSEGSTDGTIRARVDIATNVDGTILTNVTLGTVTPINIGTVNNQTGEDVTIQFDPTPRGQSVSQNTLANTQEYGGVIRQTGLTAGTDVIISGTYTSDVDMVKRLEVVENGYTQGPNLAKVRVVNVVNGVSTTAAATFTIDQAVGGRFAIGDGLFVEFEPEDVTYDQAQNSVIGSTGTVNSYDTTGLNVTVSSDPADFYGERGSGQYILQVTQAGRTGNAKYSVLFDPDGAGAVQTISTNNTLNAGVVTLADGVELNFEASTPTIGSTTRSVSGDYDGALTGFTFGGAYTGNANDTTVNVEVVTEGRVISAAEETAGSTADAAQLRYTIAGTAISGTVFAVANKTYTIGEGVTFTVGAASSLTELNLAGVGQGGAHTFATGAVLGYNGDVTVNLNASTFDQEGRDLTLRLSEIGNVVVGGNGSTQSGKLRAELVDAGGAVVTSASFALTEGTAHTIAPGLTITFDDSTYTPITLTGAGSNDDQASISVGAGAYNSTLGDKTYTLKFENSTSASVSQTNNGADSADDVGGANEASVVGSYSGLFGQQELTLTFEGTQQSEASNTTGVNNVALSGVYNGAGGDQQVSVELLGGSTTTSTTLSSTGGNTFGLTSASGYEGLAGDKSLTFTFENKSAIASSKPVNNKNVTMSAALGGYTWQPTATAFTVSFIADNQFELISNGSTFATHTLVGNSYTISGGTFDGVTLNFANLVDGNLFGPPDPLFDETGDAFLVNITPQQSVSVTDGSATVTDVDISGGAINMGAGAFASLGDLSGLSVSFNQASVASSDQVRVDLTTAKARVTGPNGTSANINIATAGNANHTIDLSAYAGLFTGGDPGVDLVISNPNDQVTGTVTYDLETKSTVTVTNTNNGNASVSGLTLTGNSLNLDQLTAAEKTTLFGATFDNTHTLDVDVSFTTSDLLVDDVFTLTLDKTAKLNIKDNAVAGTGTTYDITGSSLGNVNFDLAGKLSGGDPGFDLTINNPILGVNDSYTLDLKSGQLSVTGSSNLINLDVKTLKVGDDFSAALTGDTLEVGTRYSVGVNTPMLEAGAQYSVAETVGTLKVGEEIKVTVNSAFEPTVYTTAASVTITNGLNLNFTNGTFDVGDEFRFQARGYRGDFSVYGQYTDPAYPTTIEVEVLNNGDINSGSVMLRARRLDGGQIDDNDATAAFVDFTATAAATPNAIGGAGYIGQGVFFQFDPHPGAGEAFRVYQGDKFYLDVIGSLSQNFSSQLVLESNDNILIEYSDVNVDNQLGRMLYVGDTSLANAPGTINSLPKATLAVNTEFSIAKLDLTSQEGAEDALRIVDHAIETISATRTNTGAVQNRISQEIASLSEALFQTERYGSRIRDADIADEVATLTKAQIQQQAGAEMLRQINQLGTLSLQLVESLLG